MNALLRAATALFSIIAGVLHWDLWANHGYRSTPVRELFVVSAIVAVITGLLALVNRRPAAVPAVVANAVFLGAFAVSRLTEMPTLHGGWSEAGLAPDGVTVLGISTTLVLIVAEALAVACGLGSLLFGRGRRAAPLPTGLARA